MRGPSTSTLCHKRGCVAIKALAGNLLYLMALGSVSLLSRSLLVLILFNLCILVGVVDQNHVHQLPEAPVFDLVLSFEAPQEPA